MTSPFCRPGKRCPASLEERLKKTEEECKQKEEESVNLELELTEVKENLKKALSGGVTLGLSIQPRTQSPGLQVSPAPPAPAASPSAPLPPPPSASAPILLLLLLVLLPLLLLISLSPQSPAVLRRVQESPPFSSCDTSDAESCSLPINSASLLRRHAPGHKPPAVKGHVLRKAKVRGHLHTS